MPLTALPLLVLLLPLVQAVRPPQKTELRPQVLSKTRWFVTTATLDFDRHLSMSVTRRGRQPAMDSKTRETVVRAFAAAAAVSFENVHGSIRRWTPRLPVLGITFVVGPMKSIAMSRRVRTRLLSATMHKELAHELQAHDPAEFSRALNHIRLGGVSVFEHRPTHAFAPRPSGSRLSNVGTVAHDGSGVGVVLDGSDYFVREVPMMRASPITDLLTNHNYSSTHGAGAGGGGSLSLRPARADGQMPLPREKGRPAVPGLALPGSSQGDGAGSTKKTSWASYFPRPITDGEPVATGGLRPAKFALAPPSVPAGAAEADGLSHHWLFAGPTPAPLRHGGPSLPSRLEGLGVAAALAVLFNVLLVHVVLPTLSEGGGGDTAEENPEPSWTLMQPMSGGSGGGHLRDVEADPYGLDPYGSGLEARAGEARGGDGTDDGNSGAQVASGGGLMRVALNSLAEGESTSEDDDGAEEWEEGDAAGSADDTEGIDSAGGTAARSASRQDSGRSQAYAQGARRQMSKKSKSKSKRHRRSSRSVTPPLDSITEEGAPLDRMV